MRIEVAKVTQNEILWSKNSICDFAFFICSGVFEMDSPEGSLRKLKLEQGQLVGDFPSLLADKVRTVSSVRCITSGDTLQIKKVHLLDFLSNNPGLFICFKNRLVIN